MKKKSKKNLLVNSLTLARSKLFEEIAKMVPSFSGKFIIVTHILNDRPELLNAISQIGDIALIIAIPYSIKKETLNELTKRYDVITPSLDEIRNGKYLKKIIKKYLGKNDDLIVIEIGGYFAQIIKELKDTLQHRFIGVIESTEAGHRQYEKVDDLPCPVVSVCRGSLKRTEYSVVGNSCIFSTEHLIRKAGFLLNGKKALVIGYGKVGQGLAHSLYKYNCPVMVYDANPIMRVLAYSEGFQVPEKIEAIQQAEIIFGATGNSALSKDEISHIKNGAILVSCSSKDIEFDMEFILKHYETEEAIENFNVYRSENHFFYLLGKGVPINFIDGAVMGPVLAIVQAEVIYAIKTLLELKSKTGIYEVQEEDKKMLASKWLKTFSKRELNFFFEYLE